MDHSQASDTSAASRYALGEMNETERDAFEAHFFDCPECAEEVRTTARFLDAAEPLVREPRRVREAAARTTPLEAGGWPWLRALFWPMPLGAAASLVLLAGASLFLAGVEVPRLRRALGTAEALQPAPWQFLSVSRSAPPTVTATEGERWIGLTLSRSSEAAFPRYVCELRDADDRLLSSHVIDAAPGRDELQILVPTQRLRPGPYVLAVAGATSAANPGPAGAFTRYHFVFARASGETQDSRP